MKWDDFKNKFRKDVQQQNVEVDVDSIWNAIESDVDAINKKKKRRFFFWIFFLGIGLVSGVGFYVFSNKEINSIIVENKSFDNKKEIVKTPQSADSQSFKEDKNNDGVTNVNSVKIEENKTLTRNERQITEKSNQNINSKKSNSNSLINVRKKETSEINNEIIVDKTEFSPTQKIESKIPVEDLLKNKKQIISKPKKGNTQFDSPLIPSAFLSLKILDSRISSIDISQRFVSSIYKKELEKEWKKKGERNFNFSTEVFGGLSFANRKIEAKDPNSNTLFDIRKNNEYPMEASHLGLLLNLKTKKGIYFSSGIQRTVIAERYEYNDTQVSVDSILGVKTLLVNLTGDTIQKMGMIPETTTKVFDKEIFNTYKLFDIPVFIGYETMNDNWRFGVEAGILANISLKTKGIIPNETFEDINIGTQQDEIFKSNIGLSYHLGLTASKIIKGNLWFTIAPSLRILPADFSTETYGLSQKYTLFGVRVGVKYNFGK